MEAGVPIKLVVETAIPWLFSRDFVQNPEKFRAKAEEMAKLEQEKKLAHKDDKKDEKDQKLKEDFETLSQSTQHLVGKNDLNRFQELSAENKESNQEFLDMLNKKQGTFDGGVR